MYTDKILTCRDCGGNFAFTAGEQEFFAQKGFVNEPGRCSQCRSQRRATGGGGGMRFEGGGYGNGGDYERRPREMHETACSGCGGTARVPFVPRGDRPVYCSNCFERERSYR